MTQLASYITKYGDTVDAICHKYYNGNPNSVKAVYAANRGLAQLGVMLPPNITIVLPDIEIETTKQDGSYSLFD